jgi:hypothetical protein
MKREIINAFKWLFNIRAIIGMPKSDTLHYFKQVTIN